MSNPINNRSFSSPADSGNLPGAYTEKQAFTDSSQRTGTFLVPVMILMTIPIFFALYSLAIQVQHLQAEGLPQKDLFINLATGIFFLAAPVIFSLIIYRRIFTAAGTFLGTFYNLPRSTDVDQIVNMRFFGRIHFPPPLSALIKFDTVQVRDGKLDSLEDWVTRIGGPIKLKIEPGNAVYLERGNRFSRVVKKRDEFLGLHETVRTVLNIGPQSEEIKVKAWTKDGICITINAKGVYSLGSYEKEEGRENDLYTCSLEAARTAVEHALINGREGHEWLKSAVGRTSGLLIDYIMNRHLEELFIAGDVGGHLLSTDTMDQLLANINASLQRDGVYLSHLQITDVILPEQIKQQIIKIWEAGQKDYQTLAMSEAKAHELYVRKQALAEMLRDMVFTLANDLERSGAANSDAKLLSSIYTVLNQGMKERGNRLDSKPGMHRLSDPK